MEAPRDFEALKRRLIEIESGLPKRLRQTAAFALEHPDEVALGPLRASPSARRCRPRPWSGSRNRSGFAGFSELQGVFRTHLRTRWPDYSERLKALHEGARDSRDPLHLLHGFADSAATSIVKLREVVRREELEKAIGLLARAGTIYVVGQRRSFSVAHYLAYALAQLGVRATLVDNVGGLGPDQLSNASDADALIAISFSPYSPVTVSLAQNAQKRKTPLVVVTDSALSPIAGIADARFEIVESDFGAFRSLAATFCLAMTLAVGVAEKRGERSSR